MNEQLKEKLIEYLASLESAIKTAGEFAVDQAPIVVQEYVAYQRATSTLCMMVCLSVVILGLRMVRVLLVEFREHGDNSRPAIIAPAIVIGVVCLVFGPAFSSSYFDTCVKSWLAPRVLVIDYIRSEVKGK